MAVPCQKSVIYCTAATVIASAATACLVLMAQRWPCGGCSRAWVRQQLEPHAIQLVWRAAGARGGIQKDLRGPCLHLYIELAMFGRWQWRRDSEETVNPEPVTSPRSCGEFVAAPAEAPFPCFTNRRCCGVLCPAGCTSRDRHYVHCSGGRVQVEHPSN